MNLSEDSDGMVPIDSKARSNAFVPENPEKNVSEYKDNMDSTPISDVMMNAQEQSFEPPLMGADPRAVQRTFVNPRSKLCRATIFGSSGSGSPGPARRAARRGWRAPKTRDNRALRL